MIAYVVHYAIGLLGAGAGWYARGFCRHDHHRIMLTLSLVAIESVATVGIIG
jgi:hypothetical protein